MGSNMFFESMAASALRASANESRRYTSNSFLVFAGLGPSLSQPGGGVLPSSSAAKAKLAQATCLTCCAKVRTSAGPKFGFSFLNCPSAGRYSYFSSGMASAVERTPYSMYWKFRKKADATVSFLLSSAAVGSEVAGCCGGSADFFSCPLAPGAYGVQGKGVTSKKE